MGEVEGRGKREGRSWLAIRFWKMEVGRHSYPATRSSRKRGLPQSTQISQSFYSFKLNSKKRFLCVYSELSVVKREEAGSWNV
jgi:hypothetical protein